MLADDGILSPLAAVEAKIQARVALFLGLKDRIRKLARSSNVMVAQKAANLWTEQMNLEAELRANLDRLEMLKQGSWTFSDVAALGAFAYRMEDQISDVESLEREAAAAVEPKTDWATYLPWAILLAVPVIILARGGRR